MPNIEPVGVDRYHLGEGPVWCTRDEALYWVDILACHVHRIRPPSNQITTWTLPETVGSLAVRESGGLVVALKHRVAAFDIKTEALETLAVAEPDQPQNRFNDGKCDRQGRFVAGTMETEGRAPTGTLWRLDTDHSHHALFTGAGIPNSLCWSPDGRIMYWADSQARTIWAHDYDIVTGRPSGRRVFADLRDGPGAPDGSTVDADGYLWNAEYGGSRIVRYAPDGRVDRVIALPVSQPTCCAFGGPGLSTLYVTSARQNLDDAHLETEPLAGALLAIPTDVAGLAEPRFLG